MKLETELIDLRRLQLGEWHGRNRIRWH
jgi:hypothetical protein